LRDRSVLSTNRRHKSRARLMAGRRSVPAALMIASLLAVARPAIGQEGVGGGPVVVVETSTGAFAFETFPNEAPKTVAHILQLVRNGFYDGQRFHRAIPGFVVQWGDPQTKSLEKSADWGSGDAASS